MEKIGLSFNQYNCIIMEDDSKKCHMDFIKGLIEIHKYVHNFWTQMCNRIKVTHKK